jgi:endoglucanase
MRSKPFLMLCLAVLAQSSCAAQDWQSLWKSYVAGFMDNQVRVIDHDQGDRTTSEGQAYGMFFALVANDRSHFDALLGWTEKNLAGGDLSAQLPAWLWGRGANNQWGVLDKNSAADADLWMAYTLLEAGKIWNEPRFTRTGLALAQRIAAEEVEPVPGLGLVLMPGATGFQHGDTYRLNSSYLPLQLVLGLEHLAPGGPWKEVATAVPTLVGDSAPHGFVSDWTNFTTGSGIRVSPGDGSYDAIRVYLWAGMLDKATPHRDDLLKALSGMDSYLRTHAVPPAKVGSDGNVEDAKGPVGFSAALLPYAAALEDDQIENQQMARVKSALATQNGLLGNPPKYYDQNLALFGLGYVERQFWFDAKGELELGWMQARDGRT